VFNHKRTWLGLVAIAVAASLSTAAYAATREAPYSWPPDWFEPGAIINQSQAATVTSDVIEVRSLVGISVQVTHGNVTGTLAFQSSNDCTNFYAVLGGSFSAISGSGGEVVEIGNLRSRCYRFVYTHSSGTGSLVVVPYVKGK
jgi:hypothetical protein